MLVKFPSIEQYRHSVKELSECSLDHVQLYKDPGKIDWKTPVVIDFETYYDKEYSLSKITTEKYIRCDKFECIGVSIKVVFRATITTVFFDSTILWIQVLGFID